VKLISLKTIEEHKSFVFFNSDIFINKRKQVLDDDYTEGFCEICLKSVMFNNTTGLLVGGVKQMRESMHCPDCELNARQRLLGYVLKTRPIPFSDCVLIFEHQTPLIKALGFEMRSCHPQGFDGAEVMDITDVKGCYKLIVHSDVLEHVEDYKKALASCYDALALDGEMIFTVPFYGYKRDNYAIPDSKPEYHFDEKLNRCRAYWRFGWELLEVAERMGFTTEVITTLPDNNQIHVTGAPDSLEIPAVMRFKKCRI
jgi:hypothetical protein